MTLIKVPTNTDTGMAAPVRRTFRVGNLNHYSSYLIIKRQTIIAPCAITTENSPYTPVLLAT